MSVGLQQIYCVKCKKGLVLKNPIECILVLGLYAISKGFAIACIRGNIIEHAKVEKSCVDCTSYYLADELHKFIAKDGLSNNRKLL